MNAEETNAHGMTKKKAANRPRKSLLFVQVETVRLFENIIKSSASPGGLERRGRREEGRRSSPSLATRLLDKWTMRFLMQQTLRFGRRAALDFARSFPRRVRVAASSDPSRRFALRAFRRG